MRPPRPTERTARLVLFAAALAGIAGCGMRPLSDDQLFGKRDAGRHDAAIDVGARHDAQADRDAHIVDRDPPDVRPRDAGPPPCTADGCAAGQFCDDLTGLCAARTGTGMLGGVVTDRCTGRPLSAKVGIAGHHLCSYVGKGSYFFTDLPLGTLRLAVALDGYELVSTTVVIAPGGTVVDVPMTPGAPLTCADPPPVAPACTCVEPGCP